ncbi:hypothetical protein TYRP_016211 [Tyrophagus putrescentiae]|nr:hypothetical protein TYRP_016211 [Tyrophagus putrescentiae]
MDKFRLKVMLHNADFNSMGKILGNSKSVSFSNRQSASASKELFFHAEISSWIGLFIIISTLLLSIFARFPLLLLLQVDFENVVNGVCTSTELFRAAGEGAPEWFILGVRSKRLLYRNDHQHLIRSADGHVILSDRFLFVWLTVTAAGVKAILFGHSFIEARKRLGSS